MHYVPVNIDGWIILLVGIIVVYAIVATIASKLGRLKDGPAAAVGILALLAYAGWWFDHHGMIDLDKASGRLPVAGQQQLTAAADSLRQEAEELLVAANKLHTAIDNGRYLGDKTLASARVDSMRAAAEKMLVPVDSVQQPTAVNTVKHATLAKIRALADKWPWVGLAVGALVALILLQFIKNGWLRLAQLIVLPWAGYNLAWFFSLKHALIAVSAVVLVWLALFVIRRARSKQGFWSGVGKSAFWLVLYPLLVTAGVLLVLINGGDPEKGIKIGAIIRSAVMAFVGLLAFGWFWYTANRRFHHQPSDSWISHWPSTLACGVIGFQVLLLSSLHWLALPVVIGSTILAIPWIARFRQAVEHWKDDPKVAATEEADDQDWLDTSPKKPATKWQLLFPLKATLWLVFLEAVAISSCLIPSVWVLPDVRWYHSASLALALPWPFLFLAAWQFGYLQRLDIREIGMGISWGKPLEGFWRAGLSFVRVNPLKPWQGYTVLPLEQREQVYGTDPVQIMTPKGTAGGAVRDKLSIKTLSCVNPIQYLSLGAEDRAIVTSDEIFTEAQGNRGVLGIILRDVKEARRETLEGMTLDQALLSKGNLRDIMLPRPADAETDRKRMTWEELQQKVLKETGWELLAVTIQDVTAGDEVSLAMEELSVAIKRLETADVLADTAEKEGRGDGRRTRGQVEEVQKALSQNPEAAQYALEQLRANRLSLKAMVGEIMNRGKPASAPTKSEPDKKN